MRRAAVEEHTGNFDGVLGSLDDVTIPPATAATTKGSLEAHPAKARGGI